MRGKFNRLARCEQLMRVRNASAICICVEHMWAVLVPLLVSTWYTSSRAPAPACILPPPQRTEEKQISGNLGSYRCVFGPAGRCHGEHLARAVVGVGSVPNTGSAGCKLEGAGVGNIVSISSGQFDVVMMVTLRHILCNQHVNISLILRLSSGQPPRIIEIINLFVYTRRLCA